MTLARLLACLIAGRCLPAPAVVRAQMPAGAPIIVLPFDNPTQEPRLGWMREGAAILLSETLRGSGEVVIDREERLQAFDRLQLPASAALSRASTIKVGQVVTASLVVSGTIAMQGDQLIARARVVRLDTGRLLPEVEASGAAVRSFRRLRTARAAGARLDRRAAPPISDRLPPTPQVFELYVKGLVAETPSTALAFLEQALKARAAVRSRASGDLGPAFRSVRPSARRSTWSRPIRPDEPLLARRPLPAGAVADEPEAVRRCTADAARDAEGSSRRRPVSNAIGVAELRRVANPPPGRATYYFSQASELDPSDGDLFFNLGYAYWLDKDPKAAIYWLREAVRRDPGDGDAHFILGVALQQTGATSEATRERELATRLSSKYAEWETRAAAGDPVPRGLERLHEELLPSRARVDNIITTAGQRDQENLAAFHLDAGRRAFEREADREAIQELRRALFLSPYLAEAHLLLGRLYLRGGRPAEAVEALKIALVERGDRRGARQPRGGAAAGPGSGGGTPRDRSRAGPRPEIGRGPRPKGEAGRSVVKFCSLLH